MVLRSRTPAIVTLVVATAVTPLLGERLGWGATAAQEQASPSFWAHIGVDPDATPNPSILDERYLPQEHLSASGYPVLGTRMPMVVCEAPWDLGLALDLLLVGRGSEAETTPGCYNLPVGTNAEWMADTDVFDGLHMVEIRLHPHQGLPVTAYGPSPNGSDQPFYAWFGIFTPSAG